MQSIPRTITTSRSPVGQDYSQLRIRHDAAEGILWYFMNPHPRPCFTPPLLEDIHRMQSRVRELYGSMRPDAERIRYLVLASDVPGVFSLGGDLDLFERLIRERNRDALERYARSCLRVLHPNSTSLDLPVTTISLVQGSALGGGFEAALSSSVIIAERSAQMGLPEILFNLFPGMGAYSFLCRRLDAARAERFIRSGDTYCAQSLFEMGLVDNVVDDGEGEEAVLAYVKRHERHRNGLNAVHRLRHQVNPVTREELDRISALWVDTALCLRERDLKVMARLARAQVRLDQRAAAPRSVEG